MSGLKALHEVLETFSNPLRLDIFLFLAEKGSAAYSDLIPLTKQHGVKPSILAYHLRRLRKCLLILKDEGGRYKLSEKGWGVMRGLTTFSEASSSEKRQWLQSYEEHARITLSLIHSMLDRLGIPSYATSKVADQVYGRLQSLPLQTIPSSLIQAIITTALIDHGLYDHLTGVLQLGLTTAHLDRSTSNPKASRPLLDGEILSKIYLEYFLHRHLPTEVRDAHYMGRICLENGGDPFSPSKIFLYFPEEGTASLTSILTQFFQGLPQEIIIQDPLLTASQEGLGKGGLWPLLYAFLERGVKTTLSLTFPSNSSPTSQEGHRILSQVQTSIRSMAGMEGERMPTWIYRLPPSLLFVKDYKEALGKLLETASSMEGEVLFVNGMIPWMRNHFIGRDGSRIPWEGGRVNGILATASINIPLFAYEARGNRGLFEGMVLDAMGMAVRYFLQKKTLLSKPSPLTSMMKPYGEKGGFYHLNLYSLEALPKILIDARFPSREASSLLLDLIKRFKEHLSTLSQENDLRLLLSSVTVPPQVSSLFKKVLPEDIMTQDSKRIDPEVDEEDLIHAEVILQKFLNGGFTPLIHLSKFGSPPSHEYLLELFSRREIGTLPLNPLPP